MTVKQYEKQLGHSIERMSYKEMSNLLLRLEHLDCVFFHNYMMQERKELQPLYKRLALFYDDDAIKGDCEAILNKYSKLIKEYDDKYQIRL